MTVPIKGRGLLS